ncbi:MAG TPA: adenylate/guanylate cyclase domain-containing protein [Mycobacterium sp.]|nr:adenylate/guanylate cyclase domain-containing protein [Mycobacterium sp.]
MVEPSVEFSTVAFVDLAGFTALTEMHGDLEAADLADRFASITRSVLTTGDRLVKTIGDAVLVVSADADSGLRVVQRLIERSYADPRFPDVRAGLHHGPVVRRNGDVFGATVNLAARIAGRAASGQVLATGVVAERAAAILVTDLGQVQLRNIDESVRLFELDFGLRPDVVVDPVCRMLVRTSAATIRLQMRGTEFLFCGLDCAAKFAGAPDRYAGAPQGACQRA